MISYSKARYLRVSPRKVRLVIKAIQGRSVREAFCLLDSLNKAARYYVREALNSALHNALRKYSYREEELYISSIYANPGPQMKRYVSAPMGRANIIRRRTTHLTIVLDRFPNLTKERARSRR